MCDFIFVRARLLARLNAINGMRTVALPLSTLRSPRVSRGAVRDLRLASRFARCGESRACRIPASSGTSQVLLELCAWLIRASLNPPQ